MLKSFDWSIPVRVFIIEVSEKNLESVPTLLKSHGYILSDYDAPRVFDVRHEESQTGKPYDQAVPRG